MVPQVGNELRIADMGSAEASVCSAEQKAAERSGVQRREIRSANFPLLVAKNLLFWGSAGLSLYLLYALVSLI